MNSLFNKLAQSEREFYEKEFIAPVTINKYTPSKVQVRLDGVIMTFTAPKFDGFGIWKPISNDKVALVREATIIERLRYLELFPEFTLIVTDNKVGAGLLVHNDGRIKSTGEIPIRLLNDVEQFDCVFAAFDGNNFWFYQKNYRISGITIQELKNCLATNIHPKRLPLVGLTPGIKSAYELCWRKKQLAARKNTEDTIELSVQRAGGQFVSQRKNGEDYIVTYQVDGEQYTSTINKNLGVISAGICLSGGDREFDLQTLVTTVRLGQEQDRIVVTGR